MHRNRPFHVRNLQVPLHRPPSRVVKMEEPVFHVFLQSQTHPETQPERHVRVDECEVHRDSLGGNAPISSPWPKIEGPGRDFCTQKDMNGNAWWKIHNLPCICSFKENCLFKTATDAPRRTLCSMLYIQQRDKKVNGICFSVKETLAFGSEEQSWISEARPALFYTRMSGKWLIMQISLANFHWLFMKKCLGLPRATPSVDISTQRLSHHQRMTLILFNL